MNSGDLHKVWEIKTLKRKPRGEEALKVLERIAKQVQPIMRKHKWRVKVLSEMCPKNRSLLGLNVGAGVHVKLRLRRGNSDDDFLPFHEVLDTMLHELCHNAHGPHNASFYNLWDELRKECEDLIKKGISGEGQGFDLPGRRLGGALRKPLSSLRQSALTAAQNRARVGSLLPSGPKKIGGDNSIMAALSPMQAAAMAAERRLRDNLWCASEFGDDATGGEDEYTDSYLPKDSDKGHCSKKSSTAFEECVKLKSRKRSRCSDDGEDNFIDLTEEDVPKPGPTISSEKVSFGYNFQNGFPGDASTSSSNDECGAWQCMTCTLLNPPLAPICEVCTTQRPKDGDLKKLIWSCKFCTLENDAKMDKCGACGTWRYSYGPPIATSTPNRGT
ncbi:hypothetical protein CASFOL_040454 [Castilleja foliolosa]|uniref:Zinc ion binding protein n=1 Tax=Castilleja foliolosa TaxID=1961234 RepID=A0ABD3BC69_9LAMI